MPYNLHYRRDKVKTSVSGRNLLVCLVLILLGASGVFFSSRLSDPTIRRILLMLSVSLPVFGVGNFLARLRVTGKERALLFAGVILLVVGGVVSISELPGATGTGDDVPFEAEGYARWAAALGLFAGLFAILAGIMHREEELLDIGDRFRHITDHMGEGFILTSPDGKIVLVNPRFLSMFKLTEPKVIGCNIEDLISELAHENIKENWGCGQKNIASKYMVDFIIDGQEKHYAIYGTPIFDRKEARAGTVAMIRDVSEQVELSRHLEKYAVELQERIDEQTSQMRDSEMRTRSLLMHMNEGFASLDSSFNVRFANERFCEMVEMDNNELYQEDVFKFVDTAGKGKLLGLFELAAAGTPDRLQMDTTLISAKDNLIPIMAGVASVDDPRKDGAKYSIVITDVSEQKEMQRQLEIRATQLEAINEELWTLDRTKDGFLTNVTHELRTPLSTVRGYVEMFESGNIGELDDVQKSALDVISRNAERLGRLIEEMLEFSRMQIRGFRLKYTLLSIRELVEECMNSAEPQANEKGLSLQCKIHGGFPHVWGDRQRLAQILTNLLSNAIKFTPEGGEICVSVDRIPGETVRVAVTDTGIGIPEEFQEKIFGKFFQVDDQLERKYEGAGIGLSIAKSIAEAHGGSIELVSEHGSSKGSKFTLVLPDAFLDEDYDAADRSRVEGCRFVLVGEDMEFCDALTTLLTNWGGTVELYHGAHDALRVAGENPPGLLIIDETAADVSGRAFTALFSEMMLEQFAPVLITKSKDTPALYDGLPSKLDELDFLIKPFHSNEFFWKVHRILGGISRAHELEIHYHEFAPHPLPYTDCIILEPDSDLLSWLRTGMNNRGIQTLFCHTADEVKPFLEKQRCSILIYDSDCFSVEENDRLMKLAENSGIPVCAMCSVPGFAEEKDFLTVLTKPFSIQAVIDIIRDVLTENSRNKKKT